MYYINIKINITSHLSIIFIPSKFKIDLSLSSVSFGSIGLVTKIIMENLKLFKTSSRELEKPYKTAHDV